MLAIELIDAHDIDTALRIFRRDGFVAIRDALSPGQLASAQAGVARVIAEQTAATPLERGNRGFARYSFGHQIHHPEWAQLVDLPTILPLVDAIWGSTDHTCSGTGGDYSLPGAGIQALHGDLPDFLNDPLGRVTCWDLPTPFIIANFLMVDFRKDNGAIRFIPGTQRSPPISVPALEHEPQWMRDNIICAPAGTAIVRDVRCWHGGTANISNQTRPMTSVGYYAPWMRALAEPLMPRSIHQGLSERGRALTRHLVA